MTDIATPRLRVWPAILIVIAQLAAIFVPSFVAPGTMVQFLLMFYAPMVGTLLLVLWGLFLSRLPWGESLATGLALLVLAAITICLAHPSYYFGLLMYALPTATTILVAWLAFTPWLSINMRLGGLLCLATLVGAGATLLRMDGITGSMSAELSFRWTPTAEDRFLSTYPGQEPGQGSAPASAAKLVLKPGDWPGFRGPRRDGQARGVQIARWTDQPPEPLWKQKCGPGWSSFAVVGDHLFTQEQRGKDEVVVCYHTETGKERWVHKDPIRFEEAVAGPGPRSTPEFHDGRLYTLGAKGLLNCLDASTGKQLWSADIVKDSGAKVPQWGFSASPLVAKGIVTIHAGGPEGDPEASYPAAQSGTCVLGYAADTGKLVWTGAGGVDSYASTQLLKLAGVEQLVIISGKGVTSLDPTTGKKLWEHLVQLPKGMARVLQPARVSDTDLLFFTWGGMGAQPGVGTQRLRVRKNNDQLSAELLWTSKAMSPYFSDTVVHKGHYYGFDGQFLVCARLEDGESCWRARGHANGQVLLLPDQDLLLVLSEKGNIAQVEANPERHVLLASFQALTGKTWNHPVVAHGKLFVRNGEEIACYPVGAGGK